MNTMLLILVIAFTPYLIAGAIMIHYFYQNEIAYPERILVRKKRQGLTYHSVQNGKVVIEKSQDSKSIIKKLLLKGDKALITITDKYVPGATTGFLKRQKRFWEVYSPAIGEYHFAKLNLDNPSEKYEVLSTSDREHFINTQRAVNFITDPPRTGKDLFFNMLNQFAPLISVIAVVIIQFVVIPMIVQAWTQGAQQAVDIMVKGAQQAAGTMKQL